MKIRFLVIIVVLVAVFLGFSFNTHAQTDVSAIIAQLQAQIASLMAQIQQLIAQQNGTQAWCHTFNTNLGYANSGSVEVGQLHTALDKDGISYAPDMGNTYGEGTMSAVSAFQEKYASTVLAQYNLTHGTGFVGPSTRTKLNAFYGCDITPTPTPTPTPTQGLASVVLNSPNGGEQWKIGETHNITWTSTNIPSNGRISIGLQGPSSGSLFSEISNTGSVSWIIPSTVQPGSYKIRIFCGQAGTDWYCSPDGTYNSNPNAEDFSNSTFTISTVTTPVPPANQPSISYITPTSAGPGSKVTVYGSNFTSSTTIKIMKDGFMYTNLSNVYVSPTELQMNVDNTFFVNMDAGVTYQLVASNSSGNSNSANFTLTSSACVPDWQCGDWGSCINGWQNRTCSDYHGCGTNVNLPAVNQTCSTSSGSSCSGYSDNYVVINSVQVANGTLSFNLTNTKTSTQTVNVSIGSGTVNPAVLTVPAGTCSSPTTVTYNAPSSATITFTNSGQVIASFPVSATAGQNNSSLSVQRLFLGQYDNTKYSLTLTDPDGLGDIVVKKANGQTIWSGSPRSGTISCQTSINSGTMTFSPTDFPLTGTVVDCHSPTVYSVTAQMPAL